jgi:hypothetical protein
MASIDNSGLLDGSTIVEGPMSPGDKKWCQWPDLRFSLCFIVS